MPDYSFRWNNANHPSLAGYWDMSTLTAGGQLKDLTPNGHNGVITGTPTYTNPLIRPKTTKSMYVNAAEFVNLGPVTTLGARSITFWMVNTLNNLRNVIGFNGVTSPIGFAVHNGGAALLHMGGAYRYWKNFYPRYMVAGTPMFIAIIISTDINYCYLYVNGKPVEILTTNYGGTPAWGDFIVGNGYYGPARMTIDNLQIWNVALTPNQIWSIYRSGVPR